MDFGVQVMMMFSYGFILPTTEFHLKSYSIDASKVGYFLSICSFCYLLSSLVVSFLPSKWNKPRVIFFGIFFMAFGFLLIGPCKIIFPDSLIVVVFGLVVLGLAGGFMYVFTFPHMLEVAIKEYKYPRDDRLHDALSGLTSASLCLGEILGYTFSTFLYSSLGFSDSANIVFLILGLCALGYGVFSDAFGFIKCSKKEEMDTNSEESSKL
jgi:MFS family permease